MAFSLPLSSARDPEDVAAPSLHTPGRTTPRTSASADPAVGIEVALAGLRRKLDDDSTSPDILISAAADAARTLTGAEGVAIALRSRGAVVCRARSGDLAPDVGTPLNLQSGISGECLRSASIMVCNDTLRDARVDAEVCRSMGIGSLIAVPLRGTIGTAGILEAFSNRAGAFGEEQIDILRELAKIAEVAYQRERHAQEQQTLASLRGQRRLPALFNRQVETPNVPEISTPSLDEVEGIDSDSFSVRRYWVLGMLALAVLLVLGVWLSWREPIPEMAKAAPKIPVTSTATSADQPSPASPALEKPKAALTRAERKGERNKKDSQGIVKNAAAIELADETHEVSDPPSGTPADTLRLSPAEPKAHTPPAADTLSDTPPPQVAMNFRSAAPVASLVSDPKPMPIMGIAVSQGITHGELIHKVDPIYPVQARAQRIAGSVVLDVTIALDGTVSNIKTVRGDPLLAASARDAVRHWRYNPVLLDGKAIEAQKQITVLFKLP